MAKVICNLPNASGLINGIKFVGHKLGMISEEIEDHIAKELASIKGYFVHDPHAPDHGVKAAEGDPAPALAITTIAAPLAPVVAPGAPPTATAAASSPGPSVPAAPSGGVDTPTF